MIKAIQRNSKDEINKLKYYSKLKRLVHNEMKNDQGIGSLQKQKVEMSRYNKNTRARMKSEWTEKEKCMEGQIFDLEERNPIEMKLITCFYLNLKTALDLHVKVTATVESIRQ